MPARRTVGVNEAVFLAGAILAASPWSSPPMALALGIALALAGLTAFGPASRKLSKVLIQAGVVLLGFGMDLRVVARAGVAGVLLAAGSIVATFAVGVLLGRRLKIDAKLTTLLCAGTSICGGSAIAATGSVIGAGEAAMGVALATVFVLNAGGLYAFPLIGRALGLSPEEFGAWAAIGIHDVSSVVGAASAFDALHPGPDQALGVATAIKLARTLWIIPVAMLARGIVRRAEPGAARSTLRAPVPWFIGLFVLAAGARSMGWISDELAGDLRTLAKRALALALYLIGSGLSRRAIASIGPRPFVLGLVLWVFISVVALVAARSGLV